MSPAEQLRGFAVFVGSLVHTFSRYVSDPGARPDTDLVGYRQMPLWLDEREQTELVERLRVALGPFLDNEPGEGRARVLLSTILFPDPG